MVRAALEAEDEAEPLPFAGSLPRSENAGKEIESLRRVLRSKPRAARLLRRAATFLGQVLGEDLNATRYYAEPTAEHAFRLFRSRTEDSGVFVLLKGDLGSHHTAIDVEVFRGLAIADDVAPFVVINDNDSRAARSFTLLHELTHLLLGQSGFAGVNTETEIEEFCNNVAAEWLLPARTLDEIDIARGSGVVEQRHHIGQFARVRNLSRTMVAYRLLRANRPDQSTFERLQADFRDQWRRRRGRHRATARESAGGPSYYVVRRHRVGPGLLGFTRRMLDSGALSTDQGGQNPGRQAPAGREDASPGQGAVGRRCLLYLLDANVLIDANRDYYPLGRVPEFWDWLVDRASRHQVKIPLDMYEEILAGREDDLTRQVGRHVPPSTRISGRRRPDVTREPVFELARVRRHRHDAEYRDLRPGAPRRRGPNERSRT